MNKLISNAPWRICARFLGPQEAGHKDVATGSGVLSL